MSRALPPGEHPARVPRRATRRGRRGDNDDRRTEGANSTGHGPHTAAHCGHGESTGARERLDLFARPRAPGRIERPALGIEISRLRTPAAPAYQPDRERLDGLRRTSKGKLEKEGAADLSYSVPNAARFR